MNVFESKHPDSVSRAHETVMAKIWLFCSSVYAVSLLCCACTMFAIVQVDLQTVDWTDRNSVLIVLWALAAAQGVGVALTAYVLQSNRFAIGLACLSLVALALLNPQIDVMIALSVTLSLGVFFGRVLNVTTNESGASFSGVSVRVVVLFSAAIVAGLFLEMPLIFLPLLIAHAALMSSGVIGQLYGNYKASHGLYIASANLQ